MKVTDCMNTRSPHSKVVRKQISKRYIEAGNDASREGWPWAGLGCDDLLSARRPHRHAGRGCA